MPAASDGLWTDADRVEQQQKDGLAHAEEEWALRNLKGQSLKEIDSRMAAGS
jgi:hypothetical protein